jgi:hydrogenase maturation protein HypF
VTAPAARRLMVRGLVQGVGFRPFVYRLARRHGLTGWVRNAAGEVDIVVEGPADQLAAFRRALEAEAPPLARIGAIEDAPAEASGAGDFRILESAAAPDGRQPVSPTWPPVPRARPSCATRPTAVTATRSSRARTADRASRSSTRCRTTASARACGRSGSAMPARASTRIPGTGAITRRRTAARRAGRASGSSRHQWRTSRGGGRRGHARRGGDPVPGGFSASAASAGSISRSTPPTRGGRRLRERKHREAKPLASWSARSRRPSGSRRSASGGRAPGLPGTAHRPAPAAARRAARPLRSPPGSRTSGDRCAYTPLQHLLLEAAGRPLVMTSGNVSEEPIATGLVEARLNGSAASPTCT